MIARIDGRNIEKSTVWFTTCSVLRPHVVYKYSSAGRNALLSQNQAETLFNLDIVFSTRDVQTESKRTPSVFPIHWDLKRNGFPSA